MNTLANFAHTRRYDMDGSGRDTYVSLNNGGFRAMHSPTKSHFKPGSFAYFSPPKKPFDHKPSVSPNKVHHYQLSGSGRDYLIYKN